MSPPLDPAPASQISALALDLDLPLFRSAIQDSVTLLAQAQLPGSLDGLRSQILTRLTWCLLQIPSAGLDYSHILMLNRHHARELAHALDRAPLHAREINRFRSNGR